MIKHKTLSVYLFKQYCKYFIAITIILVGILALSNLFDILQRFKNISLSTNHFWKLLIYKIPFLINEMSALISFITMLFFLKRFSQNNELMIILCNGISLQKIIIIPACAGLILGIIIVGIVNPLGTYGLKKYENLEAKLTKTQIQESLVVPQGGGILFYEVYDNTNRIVQAESLHLKQKEIKNVIILFIDKNNNFLKRIDAKLAIIEKNILQLIDVKEIDGFENKEYKTLEIPTTLTIKSFEERFITPEKILIWNFPILIKSYLKSGISVLNYQNYFYKQLNKPLLMFGTVLLAGCFINLKSRKNLQNYILFLGLIIGFILYLLIEIFLRVLTYNGLDPLLSILLPIILLILVSNFLILHFQEA